MDPHLARLQDEIASAARNLSPEQLRQHRAGKWSAGEILEHLYLTYTGTIKGLGRVVEAGKPLATHSTWKQTAQRLIVVGFGYLPSGREAPSVARPRGIPTEQVVAEIGPRIGEMDDILGRCAEKVGPRIKILDHPILGPLSVAQWCKFHLVHGLHHVKQIRDLRTVTETHRSIKE